VTKKKGFRRRLADAAESPRIDVLRLSDLSLDCRFARAQKCFRRVQFRFDLRPFGIINAARKFGPKFLDLLF